MIEPEPIEYIERKSGLRKREKIYFEKTIRYLYETRLGKSLVKLLSRSLLFSIWFGWWQKSSFTRSKISPFIRHYEIDSAEFELEDPALFSSFNDFFIRKLKESARPLASEPALIPADGRYLVYPDIHSCEGFVVKGVKFELSKLLGDVALASQFAEGSLVIARLCPSDYHRFHFPCNGVVGKSRLINGFLFSVNPIAIKKNIHIFTENKRVITQIDSDSFGPVLFIEVGAAGVGSIHQTFLPNHYYNKGAEKGFFSFGGSSIIILFQPNRIRFSEDLLKNSSQHIESLCLMGQPLGTII